MQNTSILTRDSLRLLDSIVSKINFLVYLPIAGKLKKKNSTGFKTA